MRKIRVEQDLLLILGLSLVLLLAIYVDPNHFLRIPMGFIYVLLAPGYTLVAALFPHKHGLTGIERLILSFGLSIVTVPLVGLLLNYTFWGIRLDSILISILVFVLLNCNLAFYRRGRLSIQERFAVRLNFRMPDWCSTKLLDGLLSTVLVLSIVAVLGTLAYAVAKPKIGEAFTEFYILGPNSVAGEYPAEVVVYEPVTLIIGIFNYEHANVQYRIEKSENTNIEQIANLQLGHEETWEQPYTFALTEPGENRKVTFLLYKGDDDEPYRSLHLWITVKEKPSAQ